MLTNASLKNFLFDKNGIENLFKNIAQVTGAAVVFKLATVPTDYGLPIKFLTAVFSLFLFALSIIYAINKIIIPFLKACYAENEKYSKMENAEWRSIFSIQFLIYIGFFSVYFLIINYCFDALIAVVSK